MGTVPVSMTGFRRKAVLAVLALHDGEIVGVDRITNVVWSDSAGATSVNTVQSHVSYLRNVLGARTAILGRPPGYLLNLGRDATDVAAARRLVEQGGRHTDAEQRAASLRAALAMWRGQPLIDVRGPAWLDEQARSLERLRWQAEHALIGARLALGETSSLIPELERLTAVHPFDEQLHGQLMLALYRSGRQADALGVYRRLRGTLAEDLGIDPNHSLRDMESRILRQDLSLELHHGSRRRVDV
jgi:DNA-binding SARP family transcriptional activator